jgi:hypothetical protein
MKLTPIMGFRFQDLTTRLPDTRNLTPDTCTLLYLTASAMAAPQDSLFPNVISEKDSALVAELCVIKQKSPNGMEMID